MMQGTVKWFNDGKGFGFIESDGQDFFVHFKEIISGTGFRTLKPGDRVTFTPGKSDKGSMATKVTVSG